MVGLITRTQVIMSLIVRTINIRLCSTLNWLWQLNYKIPKAVYQSPDVGIKLIIIKAIRPFPAPLYNQS